MQRSNARIELTRVLKIESFEDISYRGGEEFYETRNSS